MIPPVKKNDDNAMVIRHTCHAEGCRRVVAPKLLIGGKSRAASIVWERFGDVGNYVEPFAGSLAVLLARADEPRIETVNDKDCYLANFWRAVSADPAGVAAAADWPVNEADLQARHKWLVDQGSFRDRVIADPEYFDARIAGWWVWGQSQWIGAGWCSRPEWIGRGQGGRSPRGLNTVDGRAPHLSSQMGVHAGNLDGRAKRPVINRGGRGVSLKQRPHLTSRVSGVVTGSPLLAWMQELADRLRHVRVCCGDWGRVVTPSCTWKIGGGQLTGVFLDPPYSHGLRDNRLYSHESADIAEEVRAWAVENQGNKLLRIALCGLWGEHKLPGWRRVEWKAPRGYSNAGPRREVIWFSPHCLRPLREIQPPLFSARSRGLNL